MSEISKTKDIRIQKLLEVSRLTIKTGNARSFIINNEDFIDTVIPSDFITLFDELVKEGHSINELKTCSNKIINIFYSTIENFDRYEPDADSFLGILEENNSVMQSVLNEIIPVYKTFVKDHANNATIQKLLSLFEKLELFAKHYTVKENVLFPVIEKNWPDYRCLQLMWSFHDDIRRNIKSIISELREGIAQIKSFNRLVGDVFFNMKSIKFREERILFPYILATINQEQLAQMNVAGYELGYPYIQPTKVSTIEPENDDNLNCVNLGTGSLTIDQIKLIFNHLPVDITYVDENDKVQYFSTPKKRIFPRTTAIIGREVNNCHPPESVHVVEKIVRSFRDGEKDNADFWIKIKDEFVLIRYFAVRDDMNNFKGVIEVSQEITDIKALEGEKRLLDW
jgi:uncharacterized protein